MTKTAVVLKLDPLVEAVKRECNVYEAQALHIMRNKPALAQLAHLHSVILETRRKLLTKATKVESRMRYVEGREAALTIQRDECMFLLQQINKGLLELGKPTLRYRPRG